MELGGGGEEVVRAQERKRSEEDFFGVCIDKGFSYKTFPSLALLLLLNRLPPRIKDGVSIIFK